MNAPVEIFFGEDGVIRAVCSDELEDLGIFEELGGRQRTYRASDVEAGEDNLWRACLSRVGGPQLGPFPRRRLALEAEMAWIREELGAGTFRSPGPAGPRTKPCTCDYDGHGDRVDPGRCRGADGLGVSWHCAQTGERGRVGATHV